jgi:phosphoglycolate phosphatase-like HAD superfamily hydrolase
VVGDTEHDIACARAAGARVIAVATGQRDISLLAACEPDLLLEDLRDTSAVVEWARGLEAEVTRSAAESLREDST